MTATTATTATRSSDTVRIDKLEKQIAALQLVIRELTGYTDAIDVDVEELLDDAFGGAEG